MRRLSMLILCLGCLMPGQADAHVNTENLPEIGMSVDMVMRLDDPKSEEESVDPLELRGVEILLGGRIDPSLRLDSTTVFSNEEDPELEEAILTRTELPFDLTSRLGRIKPIIGQALPVHRDSLDTVDEPLFIQRIFGPEGMSVWGADMTAHGLTVGVVEEGFYAHLKNELDINKATHLELGISSAYLEERVLGLDATLLHRFNADQALKLQGEIFEQEDRGGYGLVDIGLDPQWAAGFQYDQAAQDRGYTGYLTFHQNKWMRWRLQFSHFDLADGTEDEQAMLQGTFEIQSARP